MRISHNVNMKRSTKSVYDFYMFDSFVDTVETQRKLCGMWWRDNKVVCSNERLVRAGIPMWQVLLVQASRALPRRACTDGMKARARQIPDGWLYNSMLMDRLLCLLYLEILGWSQSFSVEADTPGSE